MLSAVTMTVMRFRAAVMLLLALAAMLPVARVAAQAPEPAPTEILIRPLDPVRLGERGIVDVKLATSAGQPVAGAPLMLFLDGVLDRRATTDAGGIALFRLQGDLGAGSHALEVHFDGLPGFLPSRASGELIVAPALLEIQVVPPLTGITFALDGETFTSDSAGIARLSVPQLGRFELDVIPADPAAALPGQGRAEFSRWADGIFTARRDIQIPADQPLQAGFNVSYEVHPAFVDLAGNPVNPQRISRVTVKSSAGVKYSFDATARWSLPAVAIASGASGLEAGRIPYTLESVIIDGANAVRPGSQQFYAEPAKPWHIELSLYTARFSLRDALFGFPLDASVRLEYPDGSVREIAPAPDGQIVVTELAHGSYRVSATGWLGQLAPTEVALLSDQKITLDVVSYLDIALPLMLLVFLVLSLVVATRERLPLLRAPRRLQEAEPALESEADAGMLAARASHLLSSAKGTLVAGLSAVLGKRITPQERFHNILKHDIPKVHRPEEVVESAGRPPRRRWPWRWPS
jgi:hypothetical protein